MVQYSTHSQYNSSFVTPIAEGVLLIFNAIFSVIILGEKITKNTVLGLGAIILGIFLIYCDYFKIKLF